MPGPAGSLGLPEIVQLSGLMYSELGGIMRYWELPGFITLFGLVGLFSTPVRAEQPTKSARVFQQTENIVSLELAGNSLEEYPYFEFVRAFNGDAGIEIAVDPALHPEVSGLTAEIFVVEAKNAREWVNDPTLVDVRSTGAQTVVFSGTSIRDTVFSVSGPGELSSEAFLSETGAATGLGHGYDIIIDLNRNAVLDGGDYVDGFGEEAGAYVVHDTTAPGPLNVVEVGPYSVGEIFGIPSDETREMLYYPEGIQSMHPRPLVVIGHGSGHDFRWYGFIGHHLASYGYIVMSHENMDEPTVCLHTDAILELQDTIAGGVLAGKIDAGRIVWIGHSFGGISVVTQYDRLYRGDYVPVHFSIESIVLISSMLPTAGTGLDGAQPHDVNYHLWTASGDSLVDGSAGCDLCQTYQLYERATGWRMSTTVQGTGHAWFHDGTEQWGDWVEGPCQIGKENTHLIQQGLFLPLVEHFTDGSIAAEDFFTRQYERFHPIGVDTSNPCIVVTHECRQEPGNDRFVIDDFQTHPETTVSSSGAAVAFSVEHLTEGRLDDSNNDFVWTSADPFNGATQAGPNDDSRGVVFDWTDEDRFIQWALPPEARDTRAFTFISFRGAQGTRHPNTLANPGDETFTVTLQDGEGRTSSVNIGAYGGGLEQPYDRNGGWHNEMERIEIRLDDFLSGGTGLNLSNIVAIRFNVGPTWGSSKGRIVIDELDLYRVALPSAGSVIFINGFESGSTVAWR